MIGARCGRRTNGYSNADFAISSTQQLLMQASLKTRAAVALNTPTAGYAEIQADGAASTTIAFTCTGPPPPAVTISVGGRSAKFALSCSEAAPNLTLRLAYGGQVPIALTPFARLQMSSPAATAVADASDIIATAEGTQQEHVP
jgi:hypothetical protein